MSLRALVVVSLALAAASPLAAQGGNSTRKVRMAPSEQASRAGSAVVWRESVDAALAEAKEKGKLVFWYVPSVQGSPMDRKPEIDRYLRGGPFSWPTTIELLNTHFVPVAAVARGALQKKYELLRQRFIEPGYLVLDGDGAVKLRVDQLTTLHPEWFEAPLRRLAKEPMAGFPGAPALAEAWAAYRSGELARAVQLADGVLGKEPAAPTAAEARWLAGAALCRSQRRTDADVRWRQLVDALPDQPLAWKAALEVEGHGPFVHGFEDYLPLPAAVLQHDPVDGTRAPEGTYDEAAAWQRGVAFLVAMDGGDGVLRDSTYDFGGTDSLPNVYAAVTCLAGEALLAATDKTRPGAAELPAALRERAEAMLQRILQNVKSSAWLAMSDRDEIVWARAYALRFLAAWSRRRGGDAEELKPVLRNGAAALLALQPETGVWFHEYGNPFATATALQALHGARQLGVDVDQQIVERGMRALAHDRTAQGAFTYGHSEGEPRESLEAAAGRMPLCELGLFLFGASDQARLTTAVTTGHRHHGLMAAVRKYDDHADRYHYGGFFFWFDMLGRSEATVRIDDAKVRADLIAQQRALITALPELDGCFVDSHELGRCYGTAMALLCLDSLRAGAR